MVLVLVSTAGYNRGDTIGALLTYMVIFVSRDRVSQHMSCACRMMHHERVHVQLTMAVSQKRKIIVPQKKTS